MTMSTQAARFSNIAATTTPFALEGGIYSATGHGTWNTGSVTLQIQLPDGTSYKGVATAFTADAVRPSLYLPAGEYRFAFASANDTTTGTDIATAVTDSATAQTDTGLALANATISGNPTAKALVTTIKTDVAKVQADIAAISAAFTVGNFGAALAAATAAAADAVIAQAAITAALANGTISGDPTADSLVTQIQTDMTTVQSDISTVQTDLGTAPSGVAAVVARVPE